MGKTAIKSLQQFPASQETIKANNFHQKGSWKFTDKSGVLVSDQISCDSISMDSTYSSNSLLSSSSDLMEDACSSSSSSSSSVSSPSDGPLYQLSDLMAQLPIKRGLSKYYQGKSESFTSLASVENLEDLAKRENPYRKRIKLCQRVCRPKASISKKAISRASFSSTTLVRNSCYNNADFLVTSSPPPVPVHKDF